MIHWGDFILDEKFGPILGESVASSHTRLPRTARFRALKRDECQDDSSVAQYQETSKEQWPARMAGLSNLDLSATSQEGNVSSAEETIERSRKQ